MQLSEQLESRCTFLGLGLTYSSHFQGQAFILESRSAKTVSK